MGKGGIDAGLGRHLRVSRIRIIAGAKARSIRLAHMTTKAAKDAVPTHAKAAAYIELRVDGGRALHGVGIDENLTTASFRALFSALNRALGQAAEQAA